MIGFADNTGDRESHFFKINFHKLIKGGLGRPFLFYPRRYINTRQLNLYGSGRQRRKLRVVAGGTWSDCAANTQCHKALSIGSSRYNRLARVSIGNKNDQI